MNKELKIRLNKLDPVGDALVIYSGDPNFFYFTNSDINGIFVYDWKEPELLVNKTDLELAGESWIENVRLFDKKEFKSFLHTNKIAINKRHVPLAKAKLFENSVDVSNVLERARMVKTEYEIKQIRKACNVAKQIFKTIKVSDTSTETCLMRSVECMILLRGYKPAFTPVVASKRHARIPHHKPKTTKIGKQFLIDFGVRVNGYCCDVTRLYGYGEELSEILAELEDFIKPGAEIKDVVSFAKNNIGKYLITALGHGIGIEVHELPRFSEDNETVFEKGMVFCLEPGIYKNNIGMRIENTYLLKERLINLTRF